MPVILIRQAAAVLALLLLWSPAYADDGSDSSVRSDDPWNLDLGQTLAPEVDVSSEILGSDIAGSLDDRVPSRVERLDGSHSPFDETAAALLANYRQAVDDVLDSSNAYDPRLSELYYDLATALHQQGDFEQAIEAYDQSLYIVRVNRGLYSVHQADMLRGLASCHEHLQQWEEASDRYRHLLWLHQQSVGNDHPILIPVLQEVGGWYLKAYNNHPNRPAAYLSESERLTRLGLYLTGHHEHTSLADTLGLLRNLAAGQFLWAQHLRRNPPLESNFDFPSEPGNRVRASRDLDMAISSSYRVGRSAYEKLVEIVSLTPEMPPETVATAMAELGDWHLRYGYQSAADESYRHAYQYLAEHSNTTRADDFFADPTLIGPLWLVTLDTEVVADIIVDSRGRATDLEIQAVGDEALRQRVQRHLRVARFRPSLQNGEPETTPYRLVQRIAVQ